MAIDLNLDPDELVECGSQLVVGMQISAADALVRSVRDRHCVDMPHIASLSGMAEGDVADALDGAAFLDPDSGEWQTAGVCLSGDLGHKLEAAREVCGRNSFFERNVSALEKALPPNSRK